MHSPHSSEAFELHPQLQADTLPLGRIDGGRLLLMDDCRYPWFILVPERGGVRELHDLPDAELQALALSSSRLSRRLARGFDADRMNVAALGNVVAQLHIHHVVRRRDDAVWPRPVWGIGETERYREPQRSERLERVSEVLAGLLLPL